MRIVKRQPATKIKTAKELQSIYEPVKQSWLPLDAVWQEMMTKIPWPAMTTMTRLCTR